MVDGTWKAIHHRFLKCNGATCTRYGRSTLCGKFAEKGLKSLKIMQKYSEIWKGRNNPPLTFCRKLYRFCLVILLRLVIGLVRSELGVFVLNWENSSYRISNTKNLWLQWIASENLIPATLYEILLFCVCTKGVLL